MERRKTREVRIGGVSVGGANPIVIQSMTTADTNDVEASVRQVLDLARAGSEIVRLTVPSVRAAEALREIHARVRAEGCAAPLVADIHYTPNAALLAAETVEKVRVNPGNFTDRPGRTRTGETFIEGRARVGEVFGPLVERLKANGAALRIGVNHGSLSERITAEYGDNPEGMVRSALEYVEVCERLGYREVVVSLKSSIPAVTVAANRLFAEKVDGSGGRYPLHVGVTEAGSGEEGRVRSASGNGTLLAEGLGDTIRVSLTEDPVKEVPAAREILSIAVPIREAREGASRGTPEREVRPVRIGSVTVGPGSPVAVLADEGGIGGGGEPPEILVAEGAGNVAGLRDRGFGVVLAVPSPGGAPIGREGTPDALLFPFPGEGGEAEGDPFPPGSDLLPVVVLRAESRGAVGPMVDRLLAGMPRSFERGALVAAPHGLAADLAPALEEELARRGLTWPQLLIDGGGGSAMETAVRLSPPLLAGIGDALFVRGARGAGTAWEVLQGSRRRITRVEYISCPSCGRTLFDLEEVTGLIRERTSHLKDVKIAIMGCIVNGPGEMADADFGYVGSGPKKIDLYVGFERVAKGISEEAAVDRLVELIQSRGKWIEP
ncbi:MAG: (E)-4-hydroxy-3-methylbut-2-enyl-diphosphate synthase [Candidatus Eisenbacteria bacterium]